MFKCVHILRNPFLLAFLFYMGNPFQGLGNVNSSFEIPELERMQSEPDDSLLVKGIVLDGVTKAPISGINVSIEDFSATISNDSGEFILSIPNRKAILKVFGEGFQDKLVPIKDREEIKVLLYPEPYRTLYNEGVLPFENESTLFSPYAIATWNSQTLSESEGVWTGNPNETLEDFLQGKLSGLNIVRNSGSPRSGGTISIRGFNSLHSTNGPLIIVDDMIYDNQEYGASLFSDFVYNPLADIEIKDVENVTVLKGGISTYGTRGANGVVLVKTSRAKELATRIDVGVFGSYNNRMEELPLLNAYDYRTYLSELLKSGGGSLDSISALPFMTDSKKDLSYYLYHNQTNWQKEILRNSFNQNVYLKVTGGDNIATYALSVGYRKNEGVLKGNDMTSYYTRFNGELNLSEKLKASVNISLVSNKENLFDGGLKSRTNPLYTGLIKAPFLSVHVKDSLGVASPNLEEADVFGVSNPVSILNKMQGVNQNYRFLGSVKFKYSFSSAIALQTLLGTTFDKIQEDLFIPSQGILPDTLLKAVANNKLGSNLGRFYSIYNDSRLSFTPEININNKLSAHLGIRYNHNKSEDEFGIDHNSATDEFVSLGQGVPELREAGGGIGQWNWLNTYLNVDYLLHNKYMFSFNLAMDGSSRFGRSATHSLSMGKNKFALMPSFATGWLISSEKFLAHFRGLDLLKLRASLSRVGNNDIGDYNARQIYVSKNLLGMQGLIRGNYGNPSLRWEQVDQSNIGLEGSFFDERLFFSADLYENRTKGMLLIEETVNAGGIDHYLTNAGQMKTSGVDLMVGSRLVNKGLKWDFSINLGTYRNKVLDLGSDKEPLISSYGEAEVITRIGKGANLFYGWKSEGIVRSEQEAERLGLLVKNENGELNPVAAGDIRFRDLNGDGIIDENDKMTIGNPNPKFTGGFSNTFNYKNFSLNVLFTFSYGNDIYNYSRRYLESLDSYNNQSKTALNYWQNNNQETQTPRILKGDPNGNAYFSSRWIEDGSYLRLRKASLSYNMPVKTDIIRYIRIYVTGDNLLTFTKYLGYDPEVRFTNSILNWGVDSYRIPQYRSVQLGFRLGF